MWIAIVGSLLLIASAAVYSWGKRPASNKRQRAQALERYRADLEIDHPESLER